MVAAPGPHHAGPGSPPRHQGSMETCPQIHCQLLGRPERHRRASSSARAGASRCIALAPGTGPKAITCQGAGVLAPTPHRCGTNQHATISTGKGQGVGTKLAYTSSAKSVQHQKINQSLWKTPPPRTSSSQKKSPMCLRSGLRLGRRCQFPRNTQVGGIC